LRREAPLAPGRHSAPKRDCSVEEYLAVLDAHGISHGVLTAPSFYGTDDSLLLDALDRAAGRLRGTVIVAPDIDRISTGRSRSSAPSRTASRKAFPCSICSLINVTSAMRSSMRE